MRSGMLLLILLAAAGMASGEEIELDFSGLRGLQRRLPDGSWLKLLTPDQTRKPYSSYVSTTAVELKRAPRAGGEEGVPRANPDRVVDIGASTWTSVSVFRRDALPSAPPPLLACGASPASAAATPAPCHPPLAGQPLVEAARTRVHLFLHTLRNKVVQWGGLAAGALSSAVPAWLRLLIRRLRQQRCPLRALAPSTWAPTLPPSSQHFQPPPEYVIGLTADAVRNEVAQAEATAVDPGAVAQEGSTYDTRLGGPGRAADYVELVAAEVAGTGALAPKAAPDIDARPASVEVDAAVQDAAFSGVVHGGGAGLGERRPAAAEAAAAAAGESDVAVAAALGQAGGPDLDAGGGATWVEPATEAEAPAVVAYAVAPTEVVATWADMSVAAVAAADAEAEAETTSREVTVADRGPAGASPMGRESVGWEETESQCGGQPADVAAAAPSPLVPVAGHGLGGAVSVLPASPPLPAPLPARAVAPDGMCLTAEDRLGQTDQPLQQLDTAMGAMEADHSRAVPLASELAADFTTGPATQAASANAIAAAGSGRRVAQTNESTVAQPAAAQEREAAAAAAAIEVAASSPAAAAAIEVAASSPAAAAAIEVAASSPAAAAAIEVAANSPAAAAAVKAAASSPAAAAAIEVAASSPAAAAAVKAAASSPTAAAAVEVAASSPAAAAGAVSRSRRASHSRARRAQPAAAPGAATRSAPSRPVRRLESLPQRWSIVARLSPSLRSNMPAVVAVAAVATIIAAMQALAAGAARRRAANLSAALEDARQEHARALEQLRSRDEAMVSELLGVREQLAVAHADAERHRVACQAAVRTAATAVRARAAATVQLAQQVSELQLSQAELASSLVAAVREWRHRGGVLAAALGRCRQGAQRVVRSAAVERAAAEGRRRLQAEEADRAAAAAAERHAGEVSELRKRLEEALAAEQQRHAATAAAVNEQRARVDAAVRALRRRQCRMLTAWLGMRSWMGLEVEELAGRAEKLAAEHTSMLDQARSLVEQHRMRVESVQRQLAAQVAEVVESRRTNEELTQQLEDRNCAIMELERELAATSAVVESQRRQLDELQRMLTVSDDSLAASQQEAAELEARMREAQAATEASQARVDQLLAANELLEGQVAQFVETVSMLTAMEEAHLAPTRAQAAALEKQMAEERQAAAAAVAERDKQLAQGAAELAEQRRETEAAHRARGEVAKRLEECERELRAVQSELRRREEEGIEAVGLSFSPPTKQSPLRDAHQHRDHHRDHRDLRDQEAVLQQLLAPLAGLSLPLPADAKTMVGALSPASAAAAAAGGMTPLSGSSGNGARGGLRK